MPDSAPPAAPASLPLDRLPRGRAARIVAVDWAAFVPDEAKRLRALGVEPGATISVAHRGIFAGRDPLALQIGRMVVALRRAHACAIDVEPAEGAR